MLTYLCALIILIAVILGEVLAIHSPVIKQPLFHIIMHVAGGVGVGLFLSALNRSGILSPKHRRLTIVIGAFIAGLIWEIIEAYYNITGYRLWTAAYYADTVKDLANDIVGGALVAWLTKYEFRTYEK